MSSLSTRAILFTHDGEETARTLASPTEAVQALHSAARLAMVLAQDEAGHLSATGKPFLPLVHKNESVPLARLVYNHDGEIPVIAAGYGAAGRLRQGVNSALDKAAETHRFARFVLGVDPRLFDEVWHELRDTSEPAGPPADSVPDVDEQTLATLMTPMEIPAELMQQFVGNSPAHQLARQMIMRAAKCETPVLILGDTGTGKSLAAYFIHTLGPRHEGQFIPVNCAAIPSELFEAELFGHKRGAFTGATTDKKGRLQLAANGTLFLDEVGELSPEHQAKLLHVLQDGRFTPLGAVQEELTNARVIAATNRNLLAMMQDGRFRPDLYYRLCAFIIRTPDLHSDIDAFRQIANSLWRKIAGKDDELPEDVMGELLARRWAGNVRELRSTLVQLNNLFPATPIRGEHVRALLDYSVWAAGQGEDADGYENLDAFRLGVIRQLHHAEAVLHDCRRLITAQHLGEDDRLALRRNLEEMRILLANRMRFGSKQAADAVELVEAQLADLLEKSGGSREVAEALERALQEVFDAALECTKAYT